MVASKTSRFLLQKSLQGCRGTTASSKWHRRAFSARKAVKYGCHCAEISQNRVQIAPNARGNDPTQPLEHFWSRQKNRDFCSKNRSRGAGRSPKQPPRNGTVLHFSSRKAVKYGCHCAEMSQNRVQIAPNARGNDPTQPLEHFWSRKKLRVLLQKLLQGSREIA